MSEWKDISTAPKDGTDILVCYYGKITVARWIADIWHTWGVVAPKHPDDPDKGTFSQIGPRYFEDITIDVGPTHWMPLPEPPVKP